MKTMHRLLQRQLRKYFPEYPDIPDPLRPLFNAISQSYSHLEANQALVERAMRLSSDELSEFNLRINAENDRQKVLLQKLKTTIHSLSPDYKINNDDDLLRIVDILREEIEKRKKVESDLSKAQEEAMSSLHSKELFLANISHEIRTPINAIVGMAGLLDESDLSSVQQEYLGAIKTSAEGLMALINDVLDMSKLEAGKFTLEYIPFSLKNLLLSLQRSMLLKAEEKGLDLSIHVDESIPEILEGDPTRLSQVITNLVGNALKFTSAGSVKLEITRLSYSEETHRLRFSVSDTGVGILPNNLRSIFDPFSQEDRSVTRKYGGTGLGLAISNELVSMMGGTFEVSSSYGVGSVFAFDLDFAEARNMPLQQMTDHNNLNLMGASVLLIEDNEINRYLVITLLKKWNCLVRTAPNGLEGVEWMQKEDFDLVIMDLQMPSMDGFATTLFIRNELGLEVPILALTANARESEKLRCFECGMNGYLSKPYKSLDLYLAIESLLPATSEKINVSEEGLWSLNRLKELYAGNEFHIMRTADIFVHQLSNDAHLLRKYVVDKNYEGIRKICHRLKPNIQLFEATLLNEVMMQFDELVRERNSDGVERGSLEILRICNLLIREITEYFAVDMGEENKEYSESPTPIA